VAVIASKTTGGGVWGGGELVGYFYADDLIFCVTAVIAPKTTPWGERSGVLTPTQTTASRMMPSPGVKIYFFYLAWPWCLTSWPQSWSFNAVALWTTCANLHHNQFICFQNIVVTSLVTDKWMDTWTHVWSTEQDENITPLSASLVWCRNKNKTNLVICRLSLWTSISALLKSFNSRRIAAWTYRHAAMTSTNVSSRHTYMTNAGVQLKTMCNTLPLDCMYASI